MPVRTESVAETRAAIEDAACALFTRQGFHGTGMREIAERAGISVGNIYNHFPTKEALLAALMDRFERAYTAPDTPLAEAFRTFSSLDDIERLGEASRAMVRRFADYIRLIYVDVVELDGTHIRRLFRGMRRRYEEALGERLRALARAGELGATDPVAALMTATIAYFYLFNIEHIFGVKKLYEMPDEKAIPLVARIFREGMRAR